MANVVVLSGEVKQVYDERQTQAGLICRSFQLAFMRGERQRRVHVQAFGEERDGSAVQFAKGLSEGDLVLVQGSLDENSWKKDDEEKWNHRVEVSATRIELIGESDDLPD